jgi:hypothetical protein
LLTPEEIHRYKSAAQLLHKIDCLVQLNVAMTREDFVKLHLAYCFLIGETDVLDDMQAIAREELARRKSQQ